MSSQLRKFWQLMLLTLVATGITNFSDALIAQPKIAVIGGGASGVFAAIAAAEVETPIGCKIVVFEGGSKTLTKVAISGGGRCNVLHDTSKPVGDILNGYPRGKKELTGLYNKHFTPKQAKEWFTRRGVVLKTEPDGRMFPVSDSSQTIIDTLLEAAKEAGVEVCLEKKVTMIQKEGCKFVLETKSSKKDTHQEVFDSVILATGSSRTGHEIAENLGHVIVKPVPSLFTLNAKHQTKEGGVLNGLSGVSLKNARLTFKYSVPGKKKKQALVQEGPLLITHHGISGPATLRLSAFGARQFHAVNYRGDVLVHWAPQLGTTNEIAEALWRVTFASPKRTVASVCPLRQEEDGSSPIPRRLWSAHVLSTSGFDQDTVWGEAKKKSVAALARAISEFVLDVTGKSVFKEEFVTAGGASLKEINMKCMESKKCPGLFFCGEVIDVDGVTGGFNFMNCWSTGFVAGNGAVDYIMRLKEAATEPV